MEISNKQRAQLHCILSLVPAICGSLICSPVTFAQSGVPAGPVGWYRTNANQNIQDNTRWPASGQASTNSATAGRQGSQTDLQQAGTQINPTDENNRTQMPTSTMPMGAPQLPATPSNPLMIFDPVSGGDNATAYYDANGHLQQGKTTPEPDLRDFRQQPFPQLKYPTLLPYFGYDYFKPAQDLIDARRNRLEKGSNSRQQLTPGSSSRQQSGYGFNQPNTRLSAGQEPMPPQYGTPGFAQSQIAPQYGAPGFTQSQIAPQYGTPGFAQSQIAPQYGAPGSTQSQISPQYGAPGFAQSQIAPQYGTPGSTQSETLPPYAQQDSGSQPYPQYGTPNSVPQPGQPYGAGATPYGGIQPGGVQPQPSNGQAVPPYGGIQQNGYQALPGLGGQPGIGGNISPDTTGLSASRLGDRGALGIGAVGAGLAGTGIQPGSPNGYGEATTWQPGMPAQAGVPPYAREMPTNGYGGGAIGTIDQGNGYPEVPQGQQQVDIYAGRVAGPLELMSSLPAGGAVPQTYELSGGDVLTIRLWSSTMPAQEFTQTVSQTGTLTIPGIGSFIVRGQTMDQAEHALRERMGRLYRGGDVSVTLAQQRTMLVTIAGEAYLPGSYLVPASQTAYNVLYAAGGPTIKGSMRSIEVRRAGKLVGTLDLYDYLGVGGKSTDIPLRPGDVIYIPSRFSNVAVSGEVRTPAIFELKPDENLHDALHFAGGVKASGVTQRVQINTVDPGAARVLRDINIKDDSQVADTKLYDGDEVEVFSVRNDIANRVTVEGAVDQVGDYALSGGMTVADLVSRARGTRYNAYMKRADLYRWNADNTLTLIPIDLDKALAGDPANNVALKRWDRLKVYGRDELTWTAARQVRVRGAVQHEGIYYRSDNMHASDLLRMAGGPLPEAYLDRVVLLHQHSDGSFGYDYIDASEWASGDYSNDPAIHDNDVLAVYRDDEARFTVDHTVKIDGEVVAPGIYPRGEHMHISDLVKLAGGFTPKANEVVTVAHPTKMQQTKTASLTTDEVTFNEDRLTCGNDLELKDGDVVTVQGIGNFHTQVRLVYIDGQVNRPGPVPMTSNMRLSDLIRAAGGLLPGAFVDGTEFHRNPDLLGSTSQQTVARLVGHLNDLLNDTDFQRALAVSDTQRMESVTAAATQPDSQLPIPGLSGSTSSASSAISPTLATEVLKNQRSLVSPARRMDDPELQPSGNLAVDVASAIRRPGSPADVVLEEGDTVTIPTQPTTVQVAGAVFNTRAVVFKPGASMDYYIAQAGGFAPDAAQDRIEVIHPGGGLVPASRVRRLEAGDMILVPTKVLAAKIETHRSAFDQVFHTALSTALIARLFGL